MSQQLTLITAVVQYQIQNNEIIDHTNERIIDLTNSTEPHLSIRDEHAALFVVTAQFTYRQTDYSQLMHKFANWFAHTIRFSGWLYVLHS